MTSRRQGALLTLLAINPNLTLTTDRIIDALWGEDLPTGGASTLRFHVSKLRDQLHPDGKDDRGTLLVTRPGGYLLSIDADDIDAYRYERLIGDAQRTLDRDIEAASAAFDEAEDLVVGSLIPDFEFDEFARPFLMRMTEVLLRGRTAKIDLRIRSGEVEPVVGELRQLIEEHPYSETLYERLMLALYRTGRQVEALELYRTARKRLGEDLGLEPSPDLAAVEERILLHEVERPRPAGHDATALPPDVSSFVDREEELGKLARLSAANRLVSLIGLPGAGKTRLALQFARTTRSAVFCAVPGDAGRDELTDALRAAVQAAFPQLSISARDPLATIAKLNTLIVIDGTDRSSACADMIDQLLSGGTDVRVIATGRIQLDGLAESVLPLGAMASGDDALRLFADRAGFDVAADQTELVERTGGLPGAIEAEALHAMVASEQASGAAMTAADVVPEALSALPASRKGALVRAVALDPPFGVADFIDATEMTPNKSLDVLSTLSASGFIVQAASGLAVQPLVRRWFLHNREQLNIPAALDLLERGGHGDRRPVVAADLVLREGRSRGLHAETDAALAAIAPAWWDWGPRRGRAEFFLRDAGTGLDPTDPRSESLLYLGTNFALLDNELDLAVELMHRHAAIGQGELGAASIRQDQLLSHYSFFAGDARSAVEHARRAARHAMEAGLVSAVPLLATLGFLEVLTGSFEAEAHAERLIAASASTRNPLGVPLVDELRGRYAFQVGSLDAARQRLSRAVQGYRDLGRPGWAVAPRASLVLTDCLLDEPDRARRSLAVAGAEDPSDWDSPTASAAAVANALLHDDARASELLRRAALGVADDTNPLWSYRVLIAAVRCARAGTSTGSSGPTLSGAALGVAQRSSLEIPYPDRDLVDGVEPLSRQEVAETLDILRRL